MAGHHVDHREPGGGGIVTEEEHLVPAGIRDARSLALAQLAARLGALPTERLLTALISAVDGSLLPHLAEHYSVTGYDGWLIATTDEDRRALILRAIELHIHKGTPWAVKEAIKACGYPDVSMTEHHPTLVFDGSWNFDGSEYFSSPVGQWALFRVLIQLGESLPLSAATRELLRGSIAAYQRESSVLQALHFGTHFDVDRLVANDDDLVVQVRPSLGDIAHEAHRFDGSWIFDGSVVFGPQADTLALIINFPGSTLEEAI